jgi:hypothetical protein
VDYEDNPGFCSDAAQLNFYSQILGMRLRENKMVADLSTKLRLTNQSKYDTQKAGTASKKTTIDGAKVYQFGS